MNTAKVGTRHTCTHAVCTRWPSECCDPGHNALRREPTGVATIVATCLEKVSNNNNNNKSNLYSAIQH